jgi:hypothetical protein
MEEMNFSKCWGVFKPHLRVPYCRVAIENPKYSLVAVEQWTVDYRVAVQLGDPSKLSLVPILDIVFGPNQILTCAKDLSRDVEELNLKLLAPLRI